MEDPAVITLSFLGNLAVKEFGISVYCFSYYQVKCTDLFQTQCRLYKRSRIAACYACVSGATLCSISPTSTHCCSTLQCYSQTCFSERDSSVYGRVWSHRPTCRPCCWSLIRSDALLTRYRSTTVQSALSSHCPGCRSTTADCKTCAPSV